MTAAVLAFLAAFVGALALIAAGHATRNRQIVRDVEENYLSQRREAQG